MLCSQREERRPEPLLCCVTLGMSVPLFSFTSLYRKKKKHERASRERPGTDVKPRPREG